MFVFLPRYSTCFLSPVTMRQQQQDRSHQLRGCGKKGQPPRAQRNSKSDDVNFAAGMNKQEKRIDSEKAFLGEVFQRFSDLMLK